MNVSRRALPKSMSVASDFDSFRQQETTFVLLNLFILATLLLVHTLFASYWGFPSETLIAILAGALAAQAGELFWLASRRVLLESVGMTLLSWAAICFDILVAIALQVVSNRPDTQYYVIMIVPILIAAFRMSLVPTLAILAFVNGVNLLWIWEYAQHQTHPPLNEYFEAGTVSLIYTVVGVLVWLLVNHLKQREERLSESLVNLEKAKEQLLREERLAAVGRLASGIAHEIRNPVSTIVSALSTARRSRLETSEREELFEIAAKESFRLEKLTTDFLAYARPGNPEKMPSCLDDTLGYVADACRARGSENGVSIHARPSAGLVADFDLGHVQQALVNLVINAVEASLPEGSVELRAEANDGGAVRIDVEDTGPAIPPAAVARIFEPFFTTKAQGTGLGLAIARNIARAHGGDLVLSANEPGRVCFTLTLPGGNKAPQTA